MVWKDFEEGIEIEWGVRVDVEVKSPRRLELFAVAACDRPIPGRDQREGLPIDIEGSHVGYCGQDLDCFEVCRGCSSRSKTA